MENIEKPNKILLVEDDEDIALISSRILRDYGGFEVKHAESGIIALEILPIYKPNLVLMDVMMPGLDGVETLKRIKVIPGYEDIAVIFMTAKSQIHEQELYMSLGAKGVILKPFDPTQLCQEVLNLWKSD